MKFRNILQGTEFRPRIELLVNESKNSWLRELGKNDIIHSKNVEEILDRLVPDVLKKNESKFDKAEIFLLLCAIYLHDIGRKINEYYHERESYNEIKNDPKKYHLINEYEAEAVALICLGHSRESDYSIHKIPKDFGIFGYSSSGRTLNLQNMAALLRISDELDNTFTRVRGLKENDSPRKAIRDINPIPTKGIIEFQVSPSTWKHSFLLEKMKNYTQQRLSEVQEILNDLGLPYYQIWISPKSLILPQKKPSKEEALEKLIITAASLLESKFHNIEIYKEIYKFELSIYCENIFLDNKTRIGFLAYKNISENDAFESAMILSKLKEKGNIDIGFLLTDAPISLGIKAILEAKQIQTVTIQDLLLDISDFSSSLKSYIGDYEEKEIFEKDLYIPLEIENEEHESLELIDDYLFSWLYENAEIQLTILGDYGTGKTTIAERFSYLLAKKYLEDPTRNRIPILIKLGDYRKTIRIESLITDLFVNKRDEVISYSSFEAVNRAGKLVIILDGFDEMADKYNENVIVNNFREFDKLVEQNAKIILTCRTHYFKNVMELHQLHKGSILYKAIDDKPGYRLIFLKPFTSNQSSQYLQKLFPLLYKKYIKIIRKTYDLSELSQRPILLRLLSQTLPQIETSILRKVNHAEIYREYTEFWLLRDDWRSILGGNARRKISQGLAFYLYTSEEDSIHYSRLPQIIRTLLKEKTNYSIEEIDSDIRTCTFLCRDHRGNYSFSHKSFLEYFMATYLKNVIQDSNMDIANNILFSFDFQKNQKLSKKKHFMIINNEITDFLVDLFDNPKERNLLSNIQNFLLNSPKSQKIWLYLIKELKIQTAIPKLLKILKEKQHETLAPLILSVVTNVSENKTIQYIIKNFNELGDCNILGKIVSWIRSQGVISNNNLKKIQNRYLQLKKSRAIMVSIPTNEKFKLYPFSKEAKRRRIEKINELCEDEEELNKAKRKFRNNWQKKKKEYDQFLQKQEKDEKQRLFEQAEKELRSKRSKKNK